MKHRTVLFERKNEPRENAFTVLVPQGWLMEGGIFRADHTRQLVSAQTIGAKTDLAIKREPVGSVMLRWCPLMKYVDMRFQPGGQFGLFPPGSNYMGMIVWPLLSPQEFITQMLFPWAHPQASQVQIVEQRRLPEWIARHKEILARYGSPTNLAYDAGCVTFSYREAGIRYRERAFALIESMTPLGLGSWSNCDSYYYRAPEEEFAVWEPILQTIRESVQINLEWLAMERVSQEILMQSFLNAQQAEQWRAQRRLQVQRELQQMQADMLEHKRRVQAEIRNDAYLNLTNQEEYINPYTKEIDTGSNQWRYRWVTASGQEFYTDEEHVNPNDAGILGRTDWQPSQVRPRYPDGPAKD